MLDQKTFNEKWKAFLVEGFYGLEIDIPEVTEYMDGKFEKWSKIEGFKYMQIKAKFNTGRVYVEPASLQLSEDLRETENFITEKLNEKPQYPPYK